MVKYYGTPLTPISTFEKALRSKNVLIPFPRRDDFNRAVSLCNKILIDNGAFSVWKKGISIDWNIYYEWITEVWDKIDYFIVPDVIDGTELENDQLIEDFFLSYNSLKSKAIPVWHIAESFERLQELANSFEYVAFGSSGKYATIGTKDWHKRMDEIMKFICDDYGYPTIKIHMLRCLNQKIFTEYPFYSGDSTNLARNHKRDGWENIINRHHYHDSPNLYKAAIKLEKEV